MWGKNTLKRLIKPRENQKGQALIEVLIALVLLGIVSTAFINALTTSSRAVILADEKTTAESLTRSELEYVKSQQPFSTPCPDSPWSYEASKPTAQCLSPSPHKPASPNMPTWWDPDNPHHLPDEYVGYSVIVFAEGYDADGDSIDDGGIWQVTVTVYHSETPGSSDLILTTTDFKVNR